MHSVINEGLPYFDHHSLPSQAAQELWFRSGKYTTDPRLMPNEFIGLWAIRHEDGIGESYIAHQRSVYDLGDGSVPHVELDTHILDVDPDGDMLGVGEVRYITSSNDPIYKDKPFVGWTHTEDMAREKGLGSRRLLLMNLASLAIHELPLHSGTTFCHPSVERIWQKFVTKGVAIQYTEGDRRRYRFI